MSQKPYCLKLSADEFSEAQPEMDSDFHQLSRLGDIGNTKALDAKDPEINWEQVLTFPNKLFLSPI